MSSWQSTVMVVVYSVESYACGKQCNHHQLIVETLEQGSIIESLKIYTTRLSWWQDRGDVLYQVDRRFLNENSRRWSLVIVATTIPSSVSGQSFSF